MYMYSVLYVQFIPCKMTVMQLIPRHIAIHTLRSIASSINCLQQDPEAFSHTSLFVV